MPASPSLSRFARRQVQLAKRMLPGQLSKFAISDGRKLTLPGGEIVKEEINEREMSAPFIISTMNRDREGDIMVPQGCRTHNYAKNPIVFYDHRDSTFKISHTWPCGMAEKNGRLEINIFPNLHVKSVCWFHGLDQDNVDLFGAVAAGILRMASVGFLPIEGERLPGKGHRFTEWELTEWSITALGVNAEALRLHLDAGRIKSMRLRRSLEPFAAKASKSAPKRGVKPMSDKSAVVTKAEKPDEDDWDDDDDIDVNDKTGPTEEAAQKETAADDAADKDDVPADEEKPAEEKEKAEGLEEDDVQQEPDHAQRHGAQGYGTLAAIGKAYVDQLNMMAQEHDNENLRKFVEEDLADRTAKLTRLEELLGQDYPGLKMEDVMPSMDAPEKPEEEELPEETVTKNKAVKTVVIKRLSKINKSTVMDAAEHLDEMGKHADTPKLFKGGCRYHAKNLKDMMDGMDKERDAEPDKDDMPEEAVKALQLELRGFRREMRA